MGKKIRLLALDLDGTLLNGAKQITPRTQAALERARQQGVLMAVSYTHLTLPTIA